MSQTTSGPTQAERARFYLDHSINYIGHLDTLGQLDGDTAEQNIQCLAIDFSEGVRRHMSTKREHGYSPVEAWDIAVRDEWPNWVQRELAESEHQIFEGDPEFMSDEEKEYLEFLEDEFDVPR